MRTQADGAGAAGNPEPDAGPITTAETTPWRPLLGYICVSPSDSDKQIEQLRRALAAYAGREGFVLVGVFVDRRWVSGRGLTALCSAIDRGVARHLVVPALHHLGRSPSMQLVIKGLLEQRNGARVLVMNPGFEETS